MWQQKASSISTSLHQNEKEESKRRKTSYIRTFLESVRYLERKFSIIYIVWIKQFSLLKIGENILLEGQVHLQIYIFVSSLMNLFPRYRSDFSCIQNQNKVSFSGFVNCQNVHLTRRKLPELKWNSLINYFTGECLTITLKVTTRYLRTMWQVKLGSFNTKSNKKLWFWTPP